MCVPTCIHGDIVCVHERLCGQQPTPVFLVAIMLLFVMPCFAVSYISVIGMCPTESSIWRLVLSKLSSQAPSTQPSQEQTTDIQRGGGRGRRGGISAASRRHRGGQVQVHAAAQTLDSVQ